MGVVRLIYNLRNEIPCAILRAVVGPLHIARVS